MKRKFHRKRIFRKREQKFLPDFKILTWKQSNVSFFLFKAFRKLKKTTIRTIFKNTLSQKNLSDFLRSHTPPLISHGTIINVNVVKNVNVLKKYNIVIINKNKKNNIPLTTFLTSSRNRGVGVLSQLGGDKNNA